MYFCIVIMNQVRKKILIAMGGMGHEFKVSLSSGSYVFRNCCSIEYDPAILLVLPDGRVCLFENLNFISGEGNLLELRDDWQTMAKVFHLGQWDQMLHELNLNSADLYGVVIMIHGKGGEDGLLASFLEMQGIAYAGFDVRASQLCFDKHLSKLVWRDRGWKVLDFCLAYQSVGIIDRSKFENLYPISEGWCIKPAREGSSVGVSMVFSDDELQRALELGFHYDTKLLIEPKLREFRELEVAVMRTGGHWQTSRVGEIFNENRVFYDFDSKYGLNSTKTGLAMLDDDLSAKLRNLSVDVVDSLEGQGFARVDFFLDGQQDVYINEVNSLPGFTGISMFPWLWNQEGLTGTVLLETLLKEIKPRGKRK